MPRASRCSRCTASRRATATGTSSPQPCPTERVIAPDLRGRGRSNGLPAPVRTACSTPTTSPRPSTHSASSACTWSGTRWARSSRCASPSGTPIGSPGSRSSTAGFRCRAPRASSPEDLPKVLLGPALDRLSMTFPSRAAYVEFWQRHPALGPYWNSAIEAYVRVRPRRRRARAAQLGERRRRRRERRRARRRRRATPRRCSRRPGPVDFFRAPRGLLDAAPLYSEALAAEWAARMPQLVVHDVVDVNHYTIVMSARGVDSVIPVIRARIRAARTQEGAS